MQFKVPQDVQREDRIVGPLTLRQLIICGIGFSIAYAAFTLLGKDYQLITALIPVVIVGLITLMFAFVKPMDLFFEKYVLYWIANLVLPHKRYWLKGTGDPSRMIYVPQANPKKKIDEKAALKDEAKKQKNISELTKILDKKI